MYLFLANIDFTAVDWPQAAARLHPMLLHLPIGLIVALALLEFPRLFRRSEPEHDRSRTLLVLLLAITTPLSAATGWLLHEGADYGSPIEWHERLGIGLAALSIAVAVAYWKRSENYTLGVLASFLLLLPTAHFGATLTHGSDFLTEPWEAAFSEVVVATPEESTNESPLLAEEEPVTGVDNALIPSEGNALVAIEVEKEELATAPVSVEQISYEDIAPILSEYCTKCHGERKRKARLALNTLEAILAGGEHGEVLVPGDPSASKLFTYLQEPLDTDEHMPPSEKPQPPAFAMEQIEQWILKVTADQLPTVPVSTGILAPSEERSTRTRGSRGSWRGSDDPLRTGLDFQRSPTFVPFALDPDLSIADLVTAYEGNLKRLDGPLSSAAGQATPELPITTDFFATSADPVSVATLRQHRVHVESIGENTPLLWLDFTAASLDGAQLTELLAPLASVIGELTLFGQNPNARDMTLIGMMPNLAHLDLRELDLTSQPNRSLSLRPLQGSTSISSLNLSSTEIGEGGPYSLALLPNLKRAHVWGSHISEPNLAFLARERPDLVLVGASPEPGQPLDVEPEVTFLKPVGDPMAETPENATCPVTSDPVDPAFTVLFEGRTIGFCCPNCPKPFQEDPQKYLAILDAQ